MKFYYSGKSKKKIVNQNQTKNAAEEEKEINLRPTLPF